MGDTKKQKKKFTMPMHPWDKQRIEEENLLKTEYGLKNKTEIYKMRSFLKSAQKQVLTLTPKITLPQAKKELDLLVSRFKKLGLLKEENVAADILNISLKEILDRRLQTIILKKGLARSTNQARQFIIHRHVSIGDKKITVPSYLVNLEEEIIINFSENSALNNPAHPERSVQKKTKEEKQQKVEEEEGEIVPEEELERIEKEIEG